MLALAANPYVTSAAAVVVKKAFAALATQSMRGIGDAVSERFKGDAAVALVRDELELKMKVLALPLDICLSAAVKGQSSLQGVLDVALKILQDIERFEDNLRNQTLSKIRGEGSTPDSLDRARVMDKLRGFSKQLDGILPYLSLAVSAVGLLNQGSSSLSYSHLMTASWLLRSSQGRPIIALPYIRVMRARVAAGQASLPCMQTRFLAASVSLRPSAARDDGEVSSAGPQAGSPEQVARDYGLCIHQNFEDGTYHNEDEGPGEDAFPVSQVLGIGWSTGNSLKAGDHDFAPALLISVADAAGVKGPAARAGAATPGSQASGRSHSSNASAGSTTPQTPLQQVPGGKQLVYALQVAAPATEHSRDTEDSGPDSSSDDGGEADPQPSAVLLGDAFNALLRLEYLLRLAMLEVLHERPHPELTDDQILLGFQSGSLVAGTAAAPAASAMQRMDSTFKAGSFTATSSRFAGFSPAAPGSSTATGLTRDMQRLGFGSPVPSPPQ